MSLPWAPNRLGQQFSVSAPNQVRGADILVWPRTKGECRLPHGSVFAKIGGLGVGGLFDGWFNLGPLWPLGQRFAEESKEEVVKQVLESGYAVGDVAKRLGISVQSLYKWVKVYSSNATDRYEAELRTAEETVMIMRPSSPSSGA